MENHQSVKEVFVTDDMEEVLEKLKKGWLLHEVKSHQEYYSFLMFRV